MEKKIKSIINNLDNLKTESPEQLELIRLFKRAVRHISDLDSKLKDLIKIVISMSKQPPDLVQKEIKTAFNDGVRRDDIMAAACLALIQLDRADNAVIKPLLESILKYDPVTQYRSDNYWYDN